MKNEIELKQPEDSVKQSNPQENNKKAKKNQKAPASEVVPFSALFRYATTQDWIYMIIGSLGGIVNGAAMPLFSLLFGDAANSFAPPNTADQIVDAAGDLSLQILGVGIGCYVASYVSFALWTIACERQSIQYRIHYFRSLLQQEIAYYDSINPNEISTKLAEQCFNIQQGIGDKVPVFLYSIAQFITGFIIGFIKGWQLTLVLASFLPILSIVGSLFIFGMQKLTKINNESYGKAGAVSEEALSAIRTVCSLVGQEKEVRRYIDILMTYKKELKRYSFIAGFAMGGVYFAMFGVYALGFAVGSVFVEDRLNDSSGSPYTGGTVLTVFFSVVMASLTTARATPCLKAFSSAKSAAALAFKVLDRKSAIDIEDTRGLKPSSIQGNIRFKNVSFAYPLKPDKIILNGISFEINVNEKTALVGESGCGKTTSMQLMERFYDIENGNGSITLDGNELKDLNLKWMRENIGYVGQEPVLFATSIKENLLMAKDDVTDDDIWAALKKANAADFVKSLPDQLNTFVGSNGTQLSGGQKQRLAIARAILKNPAILLLDEATSALDRKNEMEIQKTLDEISEGRTTIVIAHRLSTIINADKIIVFDEGKVVEEGKHADLIAKQGRYYTLQKLQIQTEEKEKAARKETAQKDADIKDHEMQERPSKIESESQNKAIVEEQSPIKKDEGKNEVALFVNDENSKQIDSIEQKAENTQQTKKKEPKTAKDTFETFGRLFSYNKNEKIYTLIGLLASLAGGCVLPFLAILIAQMIDILAFPDSDDFRKRANLMTGYFVIVAAVSFMANAVSLSCFVHVSETLTRKIRIDVFTKYLKMPMSWYDRPENSPGALVSKLSTDATKINMLTSSIFGIYLSALSSFITGVIISFLASWQLALIGLAVSPVTIISGKLRAKFNEAFSNISDEAYKESVAFVAEAVNNMRTVASFGKEDKLLENYSRKLDAPKKASIRNGHLSGLAFGLAESTTFFVYALLFYIGAIFMRDIDLQFGDLFQSIMGILFASIGTGNALQFSPDVGSALDAAKSIFNLLDAKPEIDIDDPKQTCKTPITGNIEFKNVWFKYPSREKQIFKGFNLKIDASKKVAFVGPSGCGKSTILGLLQRFYNPDQGEILLDGIDIKKYDLRHLRGSFGVVSQEPVLFNGTIEYNIK